MPIPHKHSHHKHHHHKKRKRRKDKREEEIKHDDSDIAREDKDELGGEMIGEEEGTYGQYLN